MKTNKLKSIKYEKERNEMIKEFDKILGFTENNRTFILIDLQKDKQKIKKINELSKKIPFIFCSGGWGYYRIPKGKKVNNKEIGLVKTLYKSEGYEIIKRKKKIMEGEIKTLTMEYEIIKKGEKSRLREEEKMEKEKIIEDKESNIEENEKEEMEEETE
jgi:hypothetical protein